MNQPAFSQQPAERSGSDNDRHGVQHKGYPPASNHLRDRSLTRKPEPGEHRLDDRSDRKPLDEKGDKKRADATEEHRITDPESEEDKSDKDNQGYKVPAGDSEIIG